MSNLLHDIKTDFLILGFTGPLRSGCTTAAKFFENEINDYIKRRSKRTLPRIEKIIHEKYIAINKLKTEIGSLEEYKSKGYVTKNKRKELLGKLETVTKRLKKYLSLRETLTVLKDYRENNFKYISMTDLLLKITIEAIIKKTSPLEGHYSSIEKTIDWGKIDGEVIKDINTKIKSRRLGSLSVADVKIYEKYLRYLQVLHEELQKKIPPDELGKLLQDLGDNARRCGNPLDAETKFDKDKTHTVFILAEEANNIIKFYRAKKREDAGFQRVKEFIIEAFRNPYEVEFFRNRYYEFFLFSIFAPEPVRRERGKWDEKRDSRDRGEKLDDDDFYKQNVGGCVYLSDIAVNNATMRSLFEGKLAKYFSLIKRPGNTSPNHDELFMHQAYSMSVMSKCISRQVGAIIVNKARYIVGAGWNDVGFGQVGCGYRRYSDLINDNNVYPLAIDGETEDFLDKIELTEKNPQHSFCYKDECSKYFTKSKIQKASGGTLGEWKKDNDISEPAFNDLAEIMLKKLTVKRLDCCRALHAEENAILQTAIIGGIGINGGTIYTTTFPCELCAKKIYQAGINRVVYTEPYPESISEDVFFKDGARSIVLYQFEGVKSHSYYRLYKSTIDKKEFQLQEGMHG